MAMDGTIIHGKKSKTSNFQEPAQSKIRIFAAEKRKNTEFATLFNIWPNLIFTDNTSCVGWTMFKPVIFNEINNFKMILIRYMTDN